VALKASADLFDFPQLKIGDRESGAGGGVAPHTPQIRNPKSEIRNCVSTHLAVGNLLLVIPTCCHRDRALFSQQTI